MPSTAAQPTSPNRGFALLVAGVVVLGIGAIAVLATGELDPEVTTALWPAAAEATGSGPSGDSTDG